MTVWLTSVIYCTSFCAHLNHCSATTHHNSTPAPRERERTYLCLPSLEWRVTISDSLYVDLVPVTTGQMLVLAGRLVWRSSIVINVGGLFYTLNSISASTHWPVPLRSVTLWQDWLPTNYHHVLHYHGTFHHHHSSLLDQLLTWNYWTVWFIYCGSL